MSSYNRYFSPAQVDSDQKDLIVSQIKAEIFELKQNERDYHDLSSQLRNLEHRYNLLQEEKTRNESDYKHRNDNNLRTIANLKTDIDTMKSTIEEKSIEYQENKAENLAIRDIADNRAADISKLKAELGASVDQNNRAKEEKRDFESQAALIKEEKRRLIAQVDSARANTDELVYRTNELEKVLRELEYDRNRVEKQSQQLASNNDSLNVELRNKTETLRNVEQQINEAERHILSLEGDIKELERANEKGRAEVVAQQRTHQQEVSKNLELNAKINNNENVLRTREIQIEDLKKDLEQLKQAHNNMIDTQYQLDDDIKNLLRQIEALTEQNNELVAQLEAFSEQDEHIRSLLNRKTKVNELKYKSEAKQSSALNQSELRERATSPSRKLRTPSYSNRRSPYK